MGAAASAEAVVLVSTALMVTARRIVVRNAGAMSAGMMDAAGYVGSATVRTSASKKRACVSPTAKTRTVAMEAAQDSPMHVAPVVQHAKTGSVSGEAEAVGTMKLQA